jgi:hypothetical protein
MLVHAFQIANPAFGKTLIEKRTVYLERDRFPTATNMIAIRPFKPSF